MNGNKFIFSIEVECPGRSAYRILTWGGREGVGEECEYALAERFGHAMRQTLLLLKF